MADFIHIAQATVYIIDRMTEVNCISIDRHFVNLMPCQRTNERSACAVVDVEAEPAGKRFRLKISKWQKSRRANFVEFIIRSKCNKLKQHFIVCCGKIVVVSKS